MPKETALAIRSNAFIRPGPDEFDSDSLPVGARVQFNFHGSDGRVHTTRGLIALTEQSHAAILATDENDQFATFVFDPAK